MNKSTSDRAGKSTTPNKKVVQVRLDPYDLCVSRLNDQRLTNWKPRRAFFRPYFFRSLTRESRVM